MPVDAIVNTANPEPTFGAGVDTAVYLAAGAERLLEEAEQKAENLRKEAQIRAEATRERYKNEAEEILRTLKSSAVCDKEE